MGSHCATFPSGLRARGSSTPLLLFVSVDGLVDAISEGVSEVLSCLLHVAIVVDNEAQEADEEKCDGGEELG